MKILGELNSQENKLKWQDLEFTFTATNEDFDEPIIINPTANHWAFQIADMAISLKILNDYEIAYKISEVPPFDLSRTPIKQIFFHDYDGHMLELLFDADDPENLTTLQTYNPHTKTFPAIKLHHITRVMPLEILKANIAEQINAGMTRIPRPNFKATGAWFQLGLQQIHLTGLPNDQMLELRGPNFFLNFNTLPQESSP